MDLMTSLLPCQFCSSDSLHAYRQRRSDRTSLSLQSLSISSVARRINTFATAAGVPGLPIDWPEALIKQDGENGDFLNEH